MNYKFSDLIEVAKVQRLNDLFYTATGIPGAVIDPEGTIVTCSGWQEVCTKFHRVNAETVQRCVESDTVFANQIGVGQKYTVYKCGNGLIVAASPIAIGGEHVANFITSQFLFHPPDRGSFLEQGRRFGFDEAAYMEAVGKIPVLDESKLQPFLEYFSEFAAMLGEMGLKQLRQLERAAALRESEQRWATTLSSIGDAVIATDKDGRITFMNAVAEGLTGWTLAEAAAKPVTDVFNIINERTREAVDNPVTKVLQEGMIAGLANDTVLLSRDGREIPIDDSGAPIRNAAGKTIGVVLVFRDITERKAADEALRESQTQMNRAQEIAHLGSWELDLMNNRLSWSDEVYRIFGLQPQEFGATYDAFLEAIHPEDRQAVDAAYSGSLRDGRDTYEIEHRVVRRSSGEIRVVHEKCEHFRDETGRIVKSVGMVHDITERKAAEQALREARDDLEQRVKWKTAELRSLIETLLRTEAYLAEAQRLSHTGSWALDVASGKYLYVSEEFSRIFGLDAQEGLPSREDFSRRIHPEDWDRANGSFEKQLGEKADITIEYRIALPNGTAKHIQAIRHPVLNDAGDVVQLVGTVIDITERRRTEEALRLASAYNRSLIEASLDPLVTIDPEGRISDVNAATELVTGFSRQELIGTDFADYFTDPEKARQGYERVFAEESVRDYPLEFRNRNGEITPVLYNASVYRDDTGNVLGVFAAARDITEQKRAEEARSRLAAIVESSDDAIISKDLDGTITSWNEGAERLYGYSASEALGRPISILMPPEQQDESIVLMRRIREGTRIDHYDTKRIRKDGGTIDVSLTLSPIRDHRGEIIGASAIARDISAQKRAEEALRLSEAYLAESQKLAHTGSWARDAKTLKAIYWSEELFRIYGFDPQQGFPMRNQMLERIHPEDRDKFNLFDRVLHEKVDCEAEYRIALPDGTVKHVHAIAHPVLTANGEVVQVVGTLMDITERKQAQEALQNLLADLESRVEERTKELSEANESLQAANKELESFSYTVSHDLRAPLRAIDGFSRMVLKGYADKLDDEGRRKLNVIRSNAQQMDQLINDLLALSRMGRKEMVQTSLDMEALVQSAWKELTLVNPERRIDFSVQRLPHAMGDQTLVKEVLVNLLSNAIKFTKYREKAIVEVGAYPEGQTNVCFVKDNGVGFDMQYYDKLFGVFQRLHSADEFEGTGVGLAIVERIIHRHGGRVWAEGKVGEGAAFYFALPRKE